MTPQESYDHLVRRIVWPFLRELGFKRTHNAFHRPVGDNWQVIGFQKSAYSDRSQVHFTVNLAVAVARLREGVWDWPSGKRPPEHICQLRERLGFLLPLVDGRGAGGSDVWWDVDAATEIGPLAETMIAALERYGFPWLNARATDDALLALFRSDEGLQEAHTVDLTWYEKIATQLNEDDLARAIAAEFRRKDDALGELRRLQQLLRAREHGPTPDVARCAIAKTVGEQAGAALRDRIDPGADEALAVVQRIEAATPGARDDRTQVAERIEALAAQYWTVLGIVSGWPATQTRPPDEIIDPWEWYATALRAHA